MSRTSQGGAVLPCTHNICFLHKHMHTYTVQFFWQKTLKLVFGTFSSINKLIFY
jgi:hypothetical protein